MFSMVAKGHVEVSVDGAAFADDAVCIGGASVGEVV